MDIHILKEELKNNPYKFICDWAEECLIYTGRNVFEILSLVPCSLIIPDISSNSGSFRSNINVLLLGPPSSGKSSLCKKFSKITYFPYDNREITSSALQTELQNYPMVSLIVEDFSQILNRPDSYSIIKALEGILGEEKRVSKTTQREKINYSTEAVGFFCGTNKDLMKYIKQLEGGLFWRFVPIMINHNAEQNREIGKYINNGVGNRIKSDDSMMKEEIIVDYYKSLADIQSRKNIDIPPIADYEFDEKMKNKILNAWMNGVSENHQKSIQDFKWNRELQEGYRFIVAHAFLNIFNRKVKKFIVEGKEYSRLILEDEDYKVGIKMMKKNIEFKTYLIKAIELNRRYIRGVEQLKEIINSSIPSLAKEILLNISPYSSQLKHEM